MIARTQKSIHGPVIRLHPADNAVVARVPVAAGTTVAAENFTAREEIPAGYKFAVRDLRRGEPILKYNVVIGFAVADTHAGLLLHSHNVELHEFQRDPAHGRDYQPTTLLPEAERAVFQGIVRPDGRVATRNFVGIISTVNCSATVINAVADCSRRSGWRSFRTWTASRRSAIRSAAAWR